MKYNFEKQNSLGGIEMKKILLTVLVLFISFSVFAQIQEVESNELVKTLHSIGNLSTRNHTKFRFVNCR